MLFYKSGNNQIGKVVKILKTGNQPSIVKVAAQNSSSISPTPSVSSGQFVPYGKLYRTVLKNGKPIQTPVVTPQSDVLPKYKSQVNLVAARLQVNDSFQVWQKQRQLQVTQGSVALNEKALTRKQILK